MRRLTAAVLACAAAVNRPGKSGPRGDNGSTGRYHRAAGPFQPAICGVR